MKRIFRFDSTRKRIRRMFILAKLSSVYVIFDYSECDIRITVDKAIIV